MQKQGGEFHRSSSACVIPTGLSLFQKLHAESRVIAARQRKRRTPNNSSGYRSGQQRCSWAASAAAVSSITAAPHRVRVTVRNAGADVGDVGVATGTAA